MSRNRANPRPEFDLIRRLPFGGAEIPLKFFDPYTAVFGGVGAGKTLAAKMLAFRAVQQRHGNHRILCHDPKKEYYPYLRAAGLEEEQIIVTNLADARAARWDIAKDVITLDHARTAAKRFVSTEERGSENPFFREAALSLVSATMEVLLTCLSDRWSFTDLHEIMKSKERFGRVLRTTAEGSRVHGIYISPAADTVAGIVATIGTVFTSPYEVVSRTWFRASRSFSIKGWLRSSDALLLGWDANSAATEVLNQMYFAQFFAHILSAPEEGQVSEVWAILDEPRFGGKIEGLAKALSAGRSKGMRVIMTPQDVEGLMTEYGETGAEEIVGLFGNIAALRQTSPRTAEWLSKRFGEAEFWDRDLSQSTGVSHTTGGSQSTTTTSQSTSINTRRVKRESILQSELMSLYTGSPTRGIPGFFLSPFMGGWRGQYTPGFIAKHLPVMDEFAPALIPRPAVFTEPVEWDEKEFDARLRRGMHERQTAIRLHSGSDANSGRRKGYLPE